MESESKASRFRKLPQEERAVGSRLADVRRYYGYSQDFCARAIQLSRNQLANIESGRVPLRFWTGWRACNFLKLNQYWLAVGSGPEEPFLDADLKPFRNILTEETLFRDACIGPLRDALFQFEMANSLLTVYSENAAKEEALWRKAIEEIVEEHLPRVPVEERSGLARKFSASAKKFFRDAQTKRNLLRKRSRKKA